MTPQPFFYYISCWSLKADFAELDVRRFHPQYTQDPAWCTARALEGYAREYGVHYPTEEFASNEVGRGVRVSPVHSQVAAAGAVFGSVGASGFERPQHFAENVRVDGARSRVGLRGSYTYHFHVA